jgi:hypothetical protein
MQRPEKKPKTTTTTIILPAVKINILANSTWSGLLSYFQGIKKEIYQVVALGLQSFSWN